MLYKNTKWLCSNCAKRYNRNYGGESRNESNYAAVLTCEECGKTGCYLLYRYRIPEKDIQFEFVSGYRHFVSYYVRVDGRYLFTDENSLLRLEYVTDVPYLHDIGQAKAEGWNIQSEKDYWLNFAAWANTIHFEYSDKLVPDDVWEAFKIFHNDPTVRRAIYKSEWEPCTADDPDCSEVLGKKQINQRVEYY